MSSPSNSPISPTDEKQYSDMSTKAHAVNSGVSSSQRDPATEKALLRKLDLHVVAPLGILFLLAFLDRVNIGNAKIQGMTKELKMVGNDYNVALIVFFPP